MQNALTLHPKVAGSSLGGALALIVLWALSLVVAVPPEPAAGLTVFLTFVGGWLAPAKAASA